MRRIWWALTNTRALGSWRRSNEQQLMERWRQYTQHYLPAKLMELDERGKDGTV
jgi:hypothetical protein